VKSIIENKKLLVIVVILVIATGILGYYVYGQYRMSQMDKYAQEAEKVVEERDRIIDEANSYAERDDIEEISVRVDEAIEKQKEVISFQEKAYQYADGPYKEIIKLLIEENQLYLQALELWKERLECIKKGDYASALELKAQEEDIYAEINKIDARKETIKSEHPEVKEHIEKTW